MVSGQQVSIPFTCQIKNLPSSLRSSSVTFLPKVFSIVAGLPSRILISSSEPECWEPESNEESRSDGVFVFCFFFDFRLRALLALRLAERKIFWVFFTAEEALDLTEEARDFLLVVEAVSLLGLGLGLGFAIAVERVN